MYARTAVSSAHDDSGSALMAGSALTSFGRYLRDQMKRKEMSRVELARRCGVSGSTISRWMTTPVRPDTANVKTLAKVLGLDYAEVLAKAGHGHAAFSGMEGSPARAQRIADMLAPDSPLSAKQREDLETAIDAITAPYEQIMQGIRRTG